MAKINSEGAVTAGCTRCIGGPSTFEWRNFTGAFGVLSETVEDPRSYHTMRREFRLFRCAGCGRGGLGTIVLSNNDKYPAKYAELERFVPDVRTRVPLPKATPEDIKAEFREGETCLQFGSNRAAAAMFRSALEKTLSAAGYKPTRYTQLYKQIESAATDGVITESRKLRAHEEVRVLGNDVLHENWQEIGEDAAALARDYTQRVIEDFYDHRETTLDTLRAKGRVPAEDKPVETDGDGADTKPDE